MSMGDCGLTHLGALVQGKEGKNRVVTGRL